MLSSLSIHGALGSAQTYLPDIKTSGAQIPFENTAVLHRTYEHTLRL
jgi:hypothetical protein